VRENRSPHRAPLRSLDGPRFRGALPLHEPRSGMGVSPVRFESHGLDARATTTASFGFMAPMRDPVIADAFHEPLNDRRMKSGAKAARTPNADASSWRSIAARSVWSAASSAPLWEGGSRENRAPRQCHWLSSVVVVVVAPTALGACASIRGCTASFHKAPRRGTSHTSFLFSIILKYRSWNRAKKS